MHHLALKAGCAQFVACRCYLVSERADLRGSGADVVQALPELLQYPVEIGADGGGHCIALIGVICRRMDSHAAAGLSVGIQSSLDIALGLIVANGCANGCTAAGGKGGDFGAALAAVKGLDQDVGHGVDLFARRIGAGEYAAFNGVGGCGGLKAAAL